VKIYGAKGEISVQAHPEHKVTCLQYDGNKLITGSSDGTMKLWNPSTGKFVYSLTPPETSSSYGTSSSSTISSSSSSSTTTWFVTNYAKKHHVSYLLNQQEFVVYLNYKSQLKAYSKKLFDPFCRRERILFQCGTHEPFETTVGQLNFFRWAFEKNILPYMREHLADILREEKLSRANGTQSSVSSTSSTESAQSSITASTSSSKSTRRRRTEKVPSSAKMLLKQETEIKLTFD